MQNIQDLQPTAFTLKDLDNELHSMALIHSLHDRYKSLLHSLMLLNNLNKNTIREAFLAKETNSRKRAEQIFTLLHLCPSILRHHEILSRSKLNKINKNNTAFLDVLQMQI